MRRFLFLFLLGLTAGQAAATDKGLLNLESDASTGQANIILRQQKPARRIGRDVGRVFYDWSPDEPGSKFEE